MSQTYVRATWNSFFESAPIIAGEYSIVDGQGPSVKPQVGIQRQENLKSKKAGKNHEYIRNVPQLMK